ncbi:MAG: hypothetical protein H0X24_23785, partial [Ktedonobacterales bacterium]|nr:hypothetical protein [Ktedonobacterales bacterium]
PNLWLSTEALRPTMVLAEDVVSGGGMLLAATGTPLTRRHLRQMHHWGISGAQIAAPPRADDANHAPTQSAVSQWLTLDERDPFMSELAEVARALYARHQRAATRDAEGSRP